MVTSGSDFDTLVEMMGPDTIDSHKNSKGSEGKEETTTKESGPWRGLTPALRSPDKMGGESRER